MDHLEVLEELKKVDEVTLLEVLELTSADIVERFQDVIYDNMGKVYKYLHE